MGGWWIQKVKAPERATIDVEMIDDPSRTLPGKDVGAAEGAPVGEALGLSVVGAAEGLALGMLVGLAEGLPVGELVGMKVSSSQLAPIVASYA